MASLTLYGSDVANGTLTSACTMSNTTGGTETSKTTTISGGSGNWAEIISLGGTVAAVTSIPATPTGKGWCYLPGAGTFATGNWSASVALQEASDNTQTEIRFFRYSGGTYTQIGTITSNTVVGSSRTVVSYAATSMSSITFGASDLLYVDLWWQDTAGASGDSPKVFESTSSSAGIANDVQITTSSFTASGTTVNKDLKTRFRLGKALDLVTRFRLGKALDLSSRFRLGKALDLATRFRLSALVNKDLSSRFRLQKALDLSSRFRLSALKNNDLASRFRLGKALDLSSRFRLAKALDLSSRFGLGKALDLSTRMRLGRALDLATRFILSSVGTSAAKDLSTRFHLVAHTYSIQDASINKIQLVKVYDPSMNFIDVIRDAPLLSCKENISAAADTVQFSLPRPIDAFDGAGQPGSMNTIVKGNIVQWWLYGAGLPTSGLLKYQGVVDEVAPTLDANGGESVGITVTPFSQVLGDHGIGTTAVTFGTAGNSATYIDTGAILRSLFTGSYVDSGGNTVSVLDPVTSHPYGYPYTMDPASLVTTGQFVAFPFQSQKLLSVTNTLLALSTASFFLRMNQDKTAFLGAFPSNPTHTLLLGQHISSIQYSDSNIPRRNVINVIGAPGIKATATGASADPSQLGPRVYYKSDNRITDQTTCNNLAAGILSILDTSTIRAKVKVPDYRGSPQSGRGYDIETFKVGDTVKIVDARAPASSSVGAGSKWGSMVWGSGKWGAPTTQTVWGSFLWDQALWSASVGSIFNTVVQIVSIQYDFYSVTLELGARQPTLSRAVFDIELRMQDATLV